MLISNHSINNIKCSHLICIHRNFLERSVSIERANYITPGSFYFRIFLCNCKTYANYHSYVASKHLKRFYNNSTLHIIAHSSCKHEIRFYNDSTLYTFFVHILKIQSYSQDIIERNRSTVL